MQFMSKLDWLFRRLLGCVNPKRGKAEQSESCDQHGDPPKWLIEPDKNVSDHAYSCGKMISNIMKQKILANTCYRSQSGALIKLLQIRRCSASNADSSHHSSMIGRVHDSDSKNPRDQLCSSMLLNPTPVTSALYCKSTGKYI